LMPQFYNGVTRLALSIDGSGGGEMSAAVLFGSLSNELFDGEPQKVVFGHCLSDCAGTGSNINAVQAVEVTSDLKEINDEEFACNGGAFFWVALHDFDGAWSDAVVAEVSKTSGCSAGGNTTTTLATDTTSTTTTTVVPPATTATATTTEDPDEPPDTSTTSTTKEPPSTTTLATSTTTTTLATSTTTTSNELVVDRQSRCGISELDAREQCKNTCEDAGDCQPGEYCWSPHENYCESIPQRTYINPVQSGIWTRCGPTGLEAEVYARTFCGEPCTWQCSNLGETCIGIHSNYCGSEYTTDDGGPTTTAATTPITTTTTTTTESSPATTTDGGPTTTTTPATPNGSTVVLVLDSSLRCGSSELQAREECGDICALNEDCPSEQLCFGTHPNFCGSFPQRIYTNPIQSTVNRCGKTKEMAQTFCGEPCTSQCSNPEESCHVLNSNWCGSSYNGN